MTLPGCRNPQQRIDDLAEKSGLVKKIVTGKRFEHVIYFNQVPSESSILHVYLEGDGSPWVSEFLISKDPTPKKPLMLNLMVLDKNPSLFLGRPCYHGLSKTHLCHYNIWTSGRYSEIVLQSMEKFLREYLEQFHYKKLIFFGHSGGGTLAMLMANRFKETNMVVTIAGNLNPAAWTEYHSYTPLYDSLNPSKMNPLDTKIIQYHLAGSEDSILPVSIIKEAVKHQSMAELFIVDGFTHNCCWVEIWPQVLNCIAQLCELNTYLN